MKKITVIIFVFSFVLSVQAQTSTFTYQGRLNDGAMAANGAYEFQFKVFDTMTVGTGSQIGLLTITTTATVVNGIFTVQLDFGSVPFSGADRYLEVAVRQNSGQSFTTLAPRQPLTSSPYAIRALSSNTATTATNSTQLGGIAANQYVITTDSRMTDARDPLPGSSNYIQNATTQQNSSNFNISGEGKADIFSAATQFNIGSNRILSNAGLNNLFVGVGSGSGNVSGTSNTFIGSVSGFGNVSGTQNTALGNGTTFGASNLTNATAIGANTVVSQSNSVVLGNNANVGIGTSTPASKLTVVGLIESTTGGVKFPDGSIQTTAAIGGSGILNQTTQQTSANFNIDGTGTANIFNAVTQYNINGNRFASIAGTNNMFIGINSGTANTVGSGNTFFGKDTGSANVAGGQNTLFGYKAGEANIGGFNSIFGYQAGIDNQAGSNTFIGSESGFFNTTGSGNTFVGRDSGRGNLQGDDNTIIGSNTAISINSGNSNSIFGAKAGLVNTGNLNTYIGYSAGAAQSSGTNNTALGANTDFGAAFLSYATAIGADAVVSTSNTIMLGRTDGSDKVRIPGLGAAGSTQLCRNASNEISTCSSSLRYKTNIANFTSGLNIVRRLRPITFDWKEGGMKDLGLGAEEVAEVDENLVIRNEKGEVEGVKYDRVGVVLVNAVNEQQTQIEAQKKQIEQQQKQLDEQKKQIELLKQLVCSQNKNAVVCKEEKK